MLFCLLLVSGLLTAPSFRLPTYRESQLRHDKVRLAYRAHLPTVEALFRSKKLPWPPRGLYFRVFKFEHQFEVWGSSLDGSYRKLTTYPICHLSGGLGPKRRAGDRQVPEGFYTIQTLTPLGTAYLSLRVDYPNASDRRRSRSLTPGNGISVHGGCQSKGCLALTDPVIQQLYVMGVEAITAGQKKIPIHIFPTYLTEAGIEKLAKGAIALNPEAAIGRMVKSGQPRASMLMRFWQELKVGYEVFQAYHRIPNMGVDLSGAYRLVQD